MAAPLMPKATAVWLVENTALTFDQIADFCGLHPLEIQAIADPQARLKLSPQALPPRVVKHRGPRYTPIAKRQDKPDAISYLLKSHPELSDAQITKIIGTTKPTIAAVRDRTHWNSPNIKPRHPVGLGLCTLQELEDAISHARVRRPVQDDHRVGEEVEGQET